MRVYYVHGSIEEIFKTHPSDYWINSVFGRSKSQHTDTTTCSPLSALKLSPLFISFSPSSPASFPLSSQFSSFALPLLLTLHVSCFPHLSSLRHCLTLFCASCLLLLLTLLLLCLHPFAPLNPEASLCVSAHTDAQVYVHLITPTPTNSFALFCTVFTKANTQKGVKLT